MPPLVSLSPITTPTSALSPNPSLASMSMSLSSIDADDSSHSSGIRVQRRCPIHGEAQLPSPDILAVPTCTPTSGFPDQAGIRDQETYFKIHTPAFLLPGMTQLEMNRLLRSRALSPTIEVDKGSHEHGPQSPAATSLTTPFRTNPPPHLFAAHHSKGTGKLDLTAILKSLDELEGSLPVFTNGMLDLVRTFECEAKTQAAEWRRRIVLAGEELGQVVQCLKFKVLNAENNMKRHYSEGFADDLMCYIETKRRKL